MLGRRVEIPMALMSYKFHKNQSLGRREEDTALSVREGREGSGILSSDELPKSSGAELSWAVGTLSPAPSHPRHTLPLDLLSTQPKRAQGHGRHSRS